MEKGAALLLIFEGHAARRLLLPCGRGAGNGCGYGRVGGTVGRTVLDWSQAAQLLLSTPKRLFPPHSRTRFNAVVATLVLEHVEALGPAFREARRVLRDGGTFYLAELHPYRQFDGTQTSRMRPPARRS